MEKLSTVKDPMFALVVHFQLRDDALAGFDELVGNILEKIAAHEPGTLIYMCHGLESGGNTRVFYELYRSKGAFQAHEDQPYVQQFLREREQYLQEPPRVEFLSLTTGIAKEELCLKRPF